MISKRTFFRSLFAIPLAGLAAVRLRLRWQFYTGWDLGDANHRQTIAVLMRRHPHFESRQKYVRLMEVNAEIFKEQPDDHKWRHNFSSKVLGV